MATQARFPWVAVSAAVAFGVVCVGAWLRVPDARPVAPEEGRLPGLGLTRIDRSLSQELLAEQLAAYDPAPLFIPSKFSSNEPPLPDEVRPEIGGPFPAIEPELTKSGGLEFAPVVGIPSGVVEGLRLTERTETPLALGRGDWKLEALISRVARIEALEAGTGRLMLALDVPKIEGLPEGDWQPLELMGAVARSGLAGELVVTASSGSEAVDEFFRRQLRREVRIGQRLPAGIYAFRVGP